MTEALDLNISALGNGMIDPKITVVGIGGAGSNIINRLKEHVDQVETVAVNTDAQHLYDVDADKKILIGRDITRGLGALYPEVGARAAENSSNDIDSALDGDVIILVVGLGGGTGTGAAPIISRIARNKAISLAIAIKPFAMEGSSRLKTAEDGLVELKESLGSVIVLENDALMKFSDLNMNEVMLEIPKKLVANVVKGVVEQISMSFLTTLAEELDEMFAEEVANELVSLKDVGSGESENIVQVRFDESGLIDRSNFPV
jgi:cell division protein FtsZ